MKIHYIKKLKFIDYCYFKAIPHQWEPQISVLCETDNVFYPQYLSEKGKWTTNFNVKASKLCLKDKMDLLNYCKQVSKTNKTFVVILKI